VGRVLSFGVLILTIVAVAAGLWYYRSTQIKPFFAVAAEPPRDSLVERLKSANPKVAEEAENEVRQLGAKALPEIQKVLKDPAANGALKKAALRACALLNVFASPALADIVPYLDQPEFTAEAAMALSLIGPEAYTPLTNALHSTHAEVRREAARSLGKLQVRAPLEASYVVPSLLEALSDPDPGVRHVACVYLGIIHEYPDAAVPALTEMLDDEDVEVRTAAATALGSFGGDAEPALPALRRAQGDKDENVAREAGLALVRLTTK
jgi:HEAT repeat protein